MGLAQYGRESDREANRTRDRYAEASLWRPQVLHVTTIRTAKPHMSTTGPHPAAPGPQWAGIRARSSALAGNRKPGARRTPGARLARPEGARVTSERSG